MRIDYNILWFENDDAWLKPTLKWVSNQLEDLGFKLNLFLYADGSKIEDIIAEIQAKTRDVDMIFMDFKLTGNTNGEKLIKVIRDKNLFTEILFYSQNENVKQIIENECGSVEGIYYAGRDTFRQKSSDVIWHTIKKIEDVESMRGLIMGAVSEIDEVMQEIVTLYCDKCGDEERVKVTASIFESVEEYLKMKDDKFKKLLPKLKLKDLIKDPLLFDADKRAKATQSVINNLDRPELKELLGDGFYKAYKTEIIGTRNRFAHVTVVVEGGVRKLKSKSSEEIFTDQRCIEIRKQLINHLERIHQIQSFLNKN